MFTGLIEHLGTLRMVEQKGDTLSLFIESTDIVEGISLGDSIAVNGVCLTVTKWNNTGFYADCSHATFQATNLSHAKNTQVNLERAMRLGDRLGGHIVSGHVDTTCTLKKKGEHNSYQIFFMETSPQWMRYIAPKGSVAIDGVSLTVGQCTETGFELVLIPHSLAHTTLHKAEVGQIFNLECDVLAKYVERLLHFSVPSHENISSKLTLADLERLGF